MRYGNETPIIGAPVLIFQRVLSARRGARKRACVNSQKDDLTVTYLVYSLQDVQDSCKRFAIIPEVLPIQALPVVRTSLQKSEGNKIEDDEPLYAYVYEYEEDSDQLWSDCSKLVVLLAAITQWIIHNKAI